MSNNKRKSNNERASTFTIVTCNIDRLTINKVTEIYENIAAELGDDDRADLIFLQETKIEESYVTNIKTAMLNNCGYQLHHNHVFSNSNEYKHGNCVLIRQGCPLSEGNLQSLSWDVEGRLVVWDCPYGVFIGIYAATPNQFPDDGRCYDNGSPIPKRYEHRKNFDNELTNFVKLKQNENRKVFLLGDWNTCLDLKDTTDDKQWSGSYKDCRVRHNQLKADRNLIDIWRERNPDEIGRYTSWVKHLKSGKKAWVRIDMILIPKDLRNAVEYIEIMDNRRFLRGERGDINRGPKYELDHIPVVMKISLSRKGGHDDSNNDDGQPSRKNSRVDHKEIIDLTN